MVINKIGYSHKEYGINCQDYADGNEFIKIVTDGCSDCKLSEIGAKLFVKYFMDAYKRHEVFLSVESIEDTLNEFISDFITFMKLKDTNEILDYLSFTFLISVNYFEFGYKTKVFYCGDGFIINKIENNIFDFIELSDGHVKDEKGSEYPLYYIYKYLKLQPLDKYVNINIEDFNFGIDTRKDIGISTDGLKYIIGTAKEKEFVEILNLGNELKMKLFINRNHQIFKDDISICI